MSKYKKFILKLSIFITFIFVICTILSYTIQILMMPKISITVTYSTKDEKHCLIPKECVYQSGFENYIYLVKEKDGLWGKQLYVEKSNISIYDDNGKYYTIDHGYLSSKIVLYSTKPIKNLMDVTELK